ncbi:hypothetical protein [Mycobacterium sp.]|uniref:hypothetical protein n=1 Tax=Mycobacterium sp. TaxID=1785 RepID=UPI002BA99695|nr:hypothetical protein [Mycobacterium sp.]HKP42133.1 hypothetical protein [Mycobacterium sp.]
MADFDLTPPGPLRIGVALGEQLWLDSPGEVARVRAVDLRAAAHQVAALREERPGVDVLVDIEAVIALNAGAARASFAAAGRVESGSAMLYVGTPAGLAGLIADIHVLGIADGAVVVPLLGSDEVDLIWDEVLPDLQTMSPTPIAARCRPA